MSYSQFIQEKAARLVAEHRVLQVFQGDVYAIFLVVGDTHSYFVNLKQDGTVSCTCAYWEYRRRICSHIRASLLYYNPPKPEKSEDSEQELSPDEIERIIAAAPDLFDPDTWR